MNPKPESRITFIVETSLKDDLEQYCADNDLNASQLMRRLLREHLQAAGVHRRPTGNSEQPDS